MACEINTTGRIDSDLPLYRLLAQTLPGMAILLFDSSLCCLAAEGRLLKRIGDPPQGLIGSNLEELAVSVALAPLTACCQAALAGGEPEFEADLDEGCFQFRFAPVRDDNDKIVAGACVCQDITSRKHAERALAQAEAQYRQLAENCSNILVLRNPDFEYTYVSPACERILGYTPEEMIGKTSLDFAHPDDQESIRIRRRSVVSILPEMEVVTTRFRHKRGHYIWLEHAGKAVYSEATGELTGYVSTLYDVTERVRMEQALRESEARYRILAESNSDIIILQNANLETTYASPAAERILGYGPEEMLGKSALDIAHPDDIDQVLRRRASITAPEKGLTPPTLMRLRHKQGHYIWIENTGQAIFSTQSGEPTGFVSTLRDVTERVQTAQAIQDSEARYRLLAEHSFDIVIMRNIRFEYIYVSPAAERILGYTPEEMVGRNGLDFVHPDDRESKLSRRLFATSSFSPSWPQATFRYRHKLGHYVWLEHTGQKVFSEQTGELVGYVSTLRDVTDRHQTEEALRASEVRFRTLAERITDALFLGDSHGIILEANPSARALFGFSADASPGKPFADVFDLADPAYQALIAARAATGVGSAEVTGIRRDGTRFPVQNTSFIFNDLDGTARTWTICHDLTSQKRYEQGLVDQENMRVALAKEVELSGLKTRMMRQMAHEFRTPLTVIQASLNAFTTYIDQLSPSQRQTRSIRIKTHIQRLTDMLDEIGAVVTDRLTSGQVHLSRVDLSAICREVAHSLEEQLSRPELYQFDLPESFVVSCDPEVMTMAATHIMRNAARFSTSTAPIDIRLARDGQDITLQVVDHGIGIPADEQARLFEPFFRASNVSAIGGLGLGLTVARMCIEAHRGTISIESTLNQGTTVTVRLPQGTAAPR